MNYQTLNEDQKKALQLMANENLGAVWIPAACCWVFPTHIRNDRGTTQLSLDMARDLAREVIAKLSKADEK